MDHGEDMAMDTVDVTHASSLSSKSKETRI